MNAGDRRTFRAHLVTVGVFLAIALIWLFMQMQAGGAIPKIGGHKYRIAVALPTSSALAKGARVTMAGADVGKVTSVKRQGMAARVELLITNPRVTPVPSDSTVALRLRTPVGENYLSIAPGRSNVTVPSGGTLAVRQADEYVDVDQILSSLQGRNRERARRLVAALGAAVDGHSEKLNQVLKDGSATFVNGGKLLHVVHHDRVAVSRLVQHLGDIAAAVGDRGHAIRVLAREGLTSFRAIRDRDAALRATLDRLPATLAAVRETTTTLRRATGQASPVLADLSAAVRELRPSVRRLPSATTTGRRVVAELGAAAPGLRKAVRQVHRLSPRLSAALPTLVSTMCQLNPLVRYLRPYTRDVLGLLLGLGSASNTYDATGHLIRATAVAGDNTLVGLPDSVNSATQTLLHSGVLSQSSLLRYNAYPKPLEAGGIVANASDARGPEDVPTTGFKYPRVTADC